MSKKDDKKKAQEDEEEDLERDEDEDEDEDEDDEEEEAAQAKPIDRARRARHEPPAHGAKRHVEAAPPDQEDPYWWTPHAVLGALLLIGLLGFFGLFNKTPLAKLAAPVAPSPDLHDEHKPAATPPPTPTPQLKPQARPTAQPPREIFGAKHLLVMYKGSRRAPPNIERTKEEAKKRADEAMKKAKADPSKFTDLVKEYSDEPNAGARGGDLGKFPKGAMVPEFQAGVEKIKVGEISDVVETPFGFHVILRTQ